jgi:hypothetical protein
MPETHSWQCCDEVKLLQEPKRLLTTDNMHPAEAKSKLTICVIKKAQRITTKKSRQFTLQPLVAKPLIFCIFGVLVANERCDRSHPVPYDMLPPPLVKGTLRCVMPHGNPRVHNSKMPQLIPQHLAWSDTVADLSSGKTPGTNISINAATANVAAGSRGLKVPFARDQAQLQHDQRVLFDLKLWVHVQQLMVAKAAKTAVHKALVHPQRICPPMALY